MDKWHVKPPHEIGAGEKWRKFDWSELRILFPHIFGVVILITGMVVIFSNAKLRDEVGALPGQVFEYLDETLRQLGCESYPELFCQPEIISLDGSSRNSQ